MESILTSVKKMLGIAEEYEHFDMDIIIHINSALATLTQLGVGPPEGFSITGNTDTWDEFISDENTLNSVKTYTYLKVKLLFDPPLNASVLTSMNQTISELEWRLNVAAESLPKEVEEGTTE